MDDLTDGTHTFPSGAKSSCFCCENGPDGSGCCTHKDYPHGQPPIERCALPEGHDGPHYYASMDGKVEELYEMPDKHFKSCPPHSFLAHSKDCCGPNYVPPSMPTCRLCGCTEQEHKQLHSFIDGYCTRCGASTKNTNTACPKIADATHAFPSGAKSSGKLPRYDLIPWDVFADRLAARYELGLKKYSEDNWRGGLQEREYVLDRANHALRHLHRAVETLRTGKKIDEDDDLAAAMWGVVFLMAAQKECAPPLEGIWQEAARTAAIEASIK